MVGYDDHLPISAHTFTILPAHLNSSINPILYGIFNPLIRNGYKIFLNKLTKNLLFNQIHNSNYDQSNNQSDKNVGKKNRKSKKIWLLLLSSKNYHFLFD